MAKHGAHPKCEHCGRALYRSKDPGWRPGKDDPYIFCRNENCPSNGGGEQVNRSKLRARRYARKNHEPPLSTPRAPSQVEDAHGPEPQPSPSVDMSDIKKKVCDVVDVARRGKPQHTVALALAIAAAHVGENEVAAVLAVKHNLGRFGFKVL